MKKNIRIKVVESCSGNYWWPAICDGNRRILEGGMFDTKYNAIRSAKTKAKRIGIKYDPEIIKLHGC